MNNLRRTLNRVLTSVALGMAALPAFATWHPVIEGEYFSDYDAADAPSSFNVFPAGIYDPTDNFIGRVDWQSDVSDTIYFYIGSAGATGYSVQQFRTGFSTEPRLTSGNQGLHVLLRPANPSEQPVLSADLMASPYGGASLTDSTLKLHSGELYALTLSSIGSTDSGASALYFVGFTIAEPVPEPSSAALLLLGAALLTAAVRWQTRSRRG
jgi:hypothetical protein